MVDNLVWKTGSLFVAITANGCHKEVNIGTLRLAVIVTLMSTLMNDETHHYDIVLLS